jgi:hypothetical protein
MAAKFIEFSDNPALLGLDTELSDDGLLPNGVGSRLDEEGQFQIPSATLLGDQ